MITQKAEEFMAAEQMKETLSYLRQGRCYEHITNDELNGLWVAAFRAIVNDNYIQAVADLEDAAAEMRLRGLHEPEYLVAAEMKKLASRMSHMPGFAALEAKADAFLQEPDKSLN